MNKAANRSQCTASSFSNMSMLHERGKTFDLIVEEDDPHHIEERLDDAETRLKILSMNTKSSVKELKKLFGTV